MFEYQIRRTFHGAGKRAILVLILVFIIRISFGVVPPLTKNDNENGWIKKIVEKLEVGDYFLTTDHDGNLLITGCFINKSIFDNKALVSIGNYDIFVAKYNKSGTLLWLQQAGGRDFDMANIISSDTLGNVYITGYFTGACFFDNYVVKSRAQRNAFSAKYSKDGKFQWVKAEGAEVYGEVTTAKRKKILSKR
jgi:hypothetical protein